MSHPKIFQDTSTRGVVVAQWYGTRLFSLGPGIEYGISQAYSWLLSQGSLPAGMVLGHRRQRKRNHGKHGPKSSNSREIIPLSWTKTFGFRRYSGQCLPGGIERESGHNEKGTRGQGICKEKRMRRMPRRQWDCAPRGTRQQLCQISSHVSREPLAGSYIRQDGEPCFLPVFIYVFFSAQ
jgi:hypothetical protein